MFGVVGPSGEMTAPPGMLGRLEAPCGMKMQVGSAGLHCGTAASRFPFAQKKFDGHVTFSIGSQPERVGTLHVPSAWPEAGGSRNQSRAGRARTPMLQSPPGSAPCRAHRRIRQNCRREQPEIPSPSRPLRAGSAGAQEV